VRRLIVGETALAVFCLVLGAGVVAIAGAYVARAKKGAEKAPAKREREQNGGRGKRYGRR
jgi:hypothetical protein